MDPAKYIKTFYETFLVKCLDRIEFLLIFILIKKIRDMYSLNCDYYTAEFPTLGDLIAHIMISGMDPNYEITRNGKGTGEMAIDFVEF